MVFMYDECNVPVTMTTLPLRLAKSSFLIMISDMMYKCVCMRLVLFLVKSTI